MLIFNFRFPDEIYFKDNKNGDPLFTSEMATEIWGKGHVTIGAVNYKSAAYVARYATKKITGAMAIDHYQRLIPSTGELIPVPKEYVTMSKFPAIGYEWQKKYNTDIWPHDHVIIGGQEQPVPRYYDKQLKKNDPATYEIVKELRELEAACHTEDQTEERLLVREQVKEIQTKSLSRDNSDA